MTYGLYVLLTFDVEGYTQSLYMGLCNTRSIKESHITVGASQELLNYRVITLVGNCSTCLKTKFILAAIIWIAATFLG